MTIPDPPQPPVQPHGSYHYIFTFQFEDQQLSWQEGLLTPEPGQSRFDLFRRILNENIRHDGAFPIPLFFTLEPNALPAAPDAT